MGLVLYQGFRLVFGTLYPAYCSFKAVKTKNVKDYVHWMTYWIVFAVFTLSEEIVDILCSFWFPLYYYCKILLIVWLLSPATRGSTLIYRQVIHPTLVNREEEIDQLMKRWKEQGYNLGVKYTKVAAQKITKTVIETAIAGGGGIVETLRHSYSMNDLQRVSNSDTDPSYPYDGEDVSDGRVLPRSWHEDPRYSRFEELDDPVKTRAVRGRRKPHTGSLLALTSKSGQLDYSCDSKDIKRSRRGSVRQSYHGTSSSLPRTESAAYATLPRKTRKTQSPQPIRNRLTSSKENIPKEKEIIPTLNRTVSVSPMKKKKKMPPKSSFDSQMELSFKKELKPQPPRVKKRDSLSPTVRAEAVEVSKQDVDMNEDDFSMTYTAEDKKESTSKCDIS